MTTRPSSLDLSIQKVFLNYDRERRIRLTRLGCLIVAVLTAAGIPLDFSLYPSLAWSFLQMRLLVIASAALVWLLLALKATQTYYKVWGILLPLAPAFSIAWNISVTEGAASPYYTALMLVIVPTALLLPWTFQENLLVSVASIGMYVWACVAQGSGISNPNFSVHLFFLVTVAGICVLGTYFTSQLRFREFVARYELDESHRTLEAANKKLVELDQAKGRFFANISHELRTPLTLLISPLEALRENPESALTPSGREMLATMDQNSMRLLKLINDLLDLVRLEEGRLNVRPSLTDLPDFLNGLSRALSQAAQEKHIDLRCKAPYDLGRRWVDPDKIERIVLNLLFNALKFTPIGGRVSLTASTDPETLTLVVEDNGIGISTDNLPFVFNRFWQADDSSRRKFGGTGIGLALVKEMAEAQGGRVSVESVEGKGTRFTVKLPAPVQAPAGASESNTTEIPASDGETAKPDWLIRLYRRADLSPMLHAPHEDDAPTLEHSSKGRHRVLVVDDEPDMRRFLKGQLSPRYEFFEAVDGQKGLDMARQYSPDVILLDMMMPEKDGLQVLTELRADEATRVLPVILLTARADEETKVKSLTAGADDFLTKPFSVTELHLKVQNLTTARELAKALHKQNQRLEATLEELKETESQLVQSEKLNALGQMSAGLIHEINNPLNYALSAVHLLKASKSRFPEPEQGAYVERLGDVEDGLKRVSQLITDLKGFTHQHQDRLENIPVTSCIQTALRFFAHRLQDSAQITVEVPDDFRVYGNSNQLIQVLVNLVQNSIDAHAAVGTGGFRLAFKAARGKRGPTLTIEDNGPGVPEKLKSKIFEPFFTTKDVGRGLGLGLSISHRLMEGMGGAISLESEPGQGARFTLQWPEAEKAPVQEALHASTL